MDDPDVHTVPDVWLLYIIVGRRYCGVKDVIFRVALSVRA